MTRVFRYAMTVWFILNPPEPFPLFTMTNVLMLHAQSHTQMTTCISTRKLPTPLNPHTRMCCCCSSSCPPPPFNHSHTWHVHTCTLLQPQVGAAAQQHSICTPPSGVCILAPPHHIPSPSSAVAALHSQSSSCHTQGRDHAHACTVPHTGIPHPQAYDAHTSQPGCVAACVQVVTLLIPLAHKHTQHAGCTHFQATPPWCMGFDGVYCIYPDPHSSLTLQQCSLWKLGSLDDVASNRHIYITYCR